MKTISIGILCLAATLGSSGQVALWERKTGTLAYSCNSIIFLNNEATKIFSGSDCHPATIRKFDVSTGNVDWNYELSDELMCVPSVRFNSSGNLFAGLEEFGNLLVFDASTSTPTLSKTLNTGTLGAFVTDFSDDGKKIAVGCVSSRLVIFDIASGNQLHNFAAHSSWVQGLDWQDAKIVTGGSDRIVRLWDSSGAAIRSFSGHTAAVLSVQFNYNGQYIVSASADATIKIWETATGNLIKTLTGHKAAVKQAVFSADGTKIVSGGNDSTIRVWETTTGKELMSFRKSGAGWVNSVAIAQDGRHVVSGTGTGEVQLWDISKSTSIVEQNQTDDNLKLYPNPAHNNLVLELNSQSIDHFTVTNVTGQTISLPLFCQNNHQCIADISTLPSGQYQCCVKLKNGQSIWQSFIKL